MKIISSSSLSTSTSVVATDPTAELRSLLEKEEPNQFSRVYNKLAEQLTLLDPAEAITKQIKDVFALCVEPALLLDLSEAKTERSKRIPGFFPKAISEAISHTIFDCDLKEDHKIFSRLNNLLERLTHLAHLLKSSVNKTLKNCGELLAELVIIYQSNRSQICEKQHDERKDLLLASAAIMGAGIPYYLVSSAFLSKIIASNTKPVKQFDASRKRVVAYKDILFKIMMDPASGGVEQMPDNPGLAYAAQLLFTLLSDSPEFNAPLSDLIFVKMPEATIETGVRHQKVHPVQISCQLTQHDFTEVLVQERQTGKIPHIESFNFGMHVISSLLTSQGLRSSDNFAVASSSNNQIKLVGNDYDDSFVSTFCHYSIQVNGRSEKRHAVRMRNILFCLPQMHEKINVQLKDGLLGIVPKILILEWLQQVHLRNAYYEKFLKQGVSSDLQFDELMQRMHLPLKLNFTAILKFCRQLAQLQGLLRQKPDATLWDLFTALEPELALVYYAKLKEKSADDILVDFFNEAIYPLSLQEKHSVESILEKLTQDQQLLVKKALSSTTQHDFEFAGGSDEPAKIAEKLLELDESGMLTEAQQQLAFRVIEGFDDLAHPSFVNLDVLDDRLLENFLAKRNTYLKTTVGSVTLINCPKLTQAGFQKIVHKFPLVRFAVGRCRGINLVEYLKQEKLSTDEAQVYAIYANGVRCALSQRNRALALQVMLGDDQELLDYLFKLTNYSHLFLYRDNRGRSLLHHAAVRGKDKYITVQVNTGIASVASQAQSIQATQLYEHLHIITWLLKHFPELAKALDGHGQSALDVAMAQPEIDDDAKEFIAARLVVDSKGHIACQIGFGDQVLLFLAVALAKNPASISVDALTHFVSLNRLYTRHEFFKYLGNDLKSLDLSGSLLSNETLEKIVQQLKQLEVITINDCNALTENCLQRLGQLDVPLKQIELSFTQACSWGLINIDELGLLPKLAFGKFKLVVTELEFDGAQRRNLQESSLVTLGHTIGTTKVEKLILAKVKMTDPAFKAICKGIKHQISMRELDFSEVNLSANQLKLLFEALEALKKLKVLHLRSLEFDDSAVLALAHFVTNNSSLEVLTLHRSCLNHKGFDVLMKAISSHPGLRVLDLNECGIDAANFKHVLDLICAQAIKKPSLQRIVDLDLGYNALPDITIANRLARKFYKELIKLRTQDPSYRIQIRFGGYNAIGEDEKYKLAGLGLFLFLENVREDLSLESVEKISRPREVKREALSSDQIRELSQLEERNKEILSRIKESQAAFPKLCQRAKEVDKSNASLYEHWNRSYENLYDPILQLNLTVLGGFDDRSLDADLLQAKKHLAMHQAYFDQIESKLNVVVRELTLLDNKDILKNENVDDDDNESELVNAEIPPNKKQQKLDELLQETTQLDEQKGCYAAVCRFTEAVIERMQNAKNIVALTLRLKAYQRRLLSAQSGDLVSAAAMASTSHFAVKPSASTSSALMGGDDHDEVELFHRDTMFH
jgi:Ran GTPase-activating protein (RanGAP) involved in mRNA processing and transport